jgi:hypothetical protein
MARAEVPAKALDLDRIVVVEFQERGLSLSPLSHFPMSKRREIMKRLGLFVVLVAAGLFTVSCAGPGYNTQKGAAIGGAAGALIGQAIGHNTTGTLIGAAGGALVGAIIGNARDQDEWNARAAAAESRQRYASGAPAAPAPEAPPGEWVTVPGQWRDGKWVPAHRVWVPVNP